MTLLDDRALAHPPWGGEPRQPEKAPLSAETLETMLDKLFAGVNNNMEMGRKGEGTEALIDILAKRAKQVMENARPTT